MKIKVEDLYDLSLGLNDIADKELPISPALKIQRAQKCVSEELVSSDKIRNKTIEKYKEKDLGDGSVRIKKDKLDDFNKEINELMGQEIDIDIDKISTNDLDGIKIKPKTLRLLETILNAE